MEQILSYFPDLNDTQIRLLSQLNDLYKDWNQKINVVSRKDVELLYERHVLHSMSIAKVIQFKPMSRVMDLGTGGGFPGIPLAILFPETEFHMIDSIGKKIRVVQDVIQGLGLKNAQATQIRAEELEEDFDFVVCRAVAPLETLVYWTKDKFSQNQYHDLRNGLLCLKGGELEDEIAAVKNKKITIYPLKDMFKEEFFETKKIVHVPMT
jgi:16S rRNA (guanine527-N7)-methyltransferase